jgi:hypothetical protein
LYRATSVSYQHEDKFFGSPQITKAASELLPIANIGLLNPLAQKCHGGLKIWARSFAQIEELRRQVMVLFGVLITNLLSLVVDRE